MKLKTVFFDIGNVLLFFSFPKMLDQLATCTGMSPIQIQQFLFESDLRELYEKGMISTEQLYRAFLKDSPQPFLLHEFINSFADIFTPNTEAWPLVENLKKEGVRLILLSNTSEGHFNYIYPRYPILQQFDHKILSYEVGAWKPDFLIFERALATAQCAPEECFYTDDVPEFVASARKVGLHGEVFIDVPTLKQQLESLSQ